MKAPPIDEEKIKGYLLGHIAEEDESEVEARLLTDRAFYEELSVVEDELIDQYLRGALSPSDRQSFESHFVKSSERQQKVRFAKALKKYVSVTADQSETNPAEVAIPSDSREIVTVVSAPRRSSIFPFSRPLVSYALAAAILIFVGAGLFMVLRDRAGSGRVLAIDLTPGAVTRDGGEVKQVSLTRDVESVRLQLALPKNEYQSYEAALRDSSLRTLFTAKDLKPQVSDSKAAVIVDVKADLLSPGDYRMQLSGTTTAGRSESVATFPFTIRNP